MKGHLELPTGERLAKPLLIGKWDEAMYAEMPDDSQILLWKKSAPPPDPTRCAQPPSKTKHSRVRPFLGPWHCNLVEVFPTVLNCDLAGAGIT